ncbi:MAG: DUF433 domain-containing protein [Symploca sp. SIO1B1]|nr:DUF433 domain-containing protein [Symploca sp. SIO1B1]
MKSGIQKPFILCSHCIVETRHGASLQGLRGCLICCLVCGGDACIGKTRIPVWGLVSLRYQGASDARILEGYPQLTAADLVNAWAYAEAYPEEIEEALREEDKE